MMSTRVVRLTSATPGAIGSLLVSGPDASDLVARFFRPRYRGRDSSKNIPIATAQFGSWSLTPAVSEELVLCRTEEASFELHCHGGLVVQRIIEQLVQCGCQWESRPSIDRLPDHQRQTLEKLAQLSLIEAVTEKTAAILLDQKRGALRKTLTKIANHLAAKQTHEAAAELEKLVRFSRLGEHLTHPWDVQLAGPPNVGKSSLMNRFLGFQRAIVHASAGTTRDLIQGVTSLQGWPVRFTDSAGIRDFDPSVSQIEQAGIARSLEAARQMDLILLVMHPSHGYEPVHQAIENNEPQKCLRVLNQCDTLTGIQAEELARSLNAVPVSAASGEGIDSLLDQVIARLVPASPRPGQAIIFLPEISQAIKESLGELRLGNLSRSLEIIRQFLPNEEFNQTSLQESNIKPN